MSIKNEDPKLSDNMEKPQKEASACGPGCGCHTAGPSNRIRWIVGVVIILAAGALVARAVIKNNGASVEKAAPTFASVPTAGQVAAPAVGAVSVTKEASAPVPGAVPATNSITVQEIGALSDLNAVAADTGGVFVFLAGKNEPQIKAPLAQMRSAAKTIEAQGQKIGIFTLKPGSRDYEQIATQMQVPGVLVAVKGGGMIPVSGGITETKLIQGFVAASSSGGGCGPSGCGPRGCN